MAAFAVIRISLAGQESLLFRDRLNGNAGSAEKRIALKEALVTDATFRDNRGLDKGCGGNSTGRRRRDSIDENFETRLTEHDGEHGRSIQDHLGRPFSSYRRSAWSIDGPLCSAAPRLPMAVRVLRIASRLRWRRTASRRSRIAPITEEDVTTRKR